MNDSWGFRLTDRHWKEPGHLIRELAAAAGHDANFLLNVGPRPDGKLPGESLERRAAIGRWLQVNGSSIYGTRGGPVAPRNWGVATQRGTPFLCTCCPWPTGCSPCPRTRAGSDGPVCSMAAIG